MTIIDELLILLDDLGETSLETIPSYFDNYTNQIIFSSLGRLVHRGWVIKKTKKQENSYSISIHGIDELNRTLDVIKADETPVWDHHWRLVIFDIPESKRKLRDLFRETLREHGFGMLKSSIWLSPWNKKEEIKRIAKRHGLSDQIIQLETANGDSYQSVVLIQQSWDWKAIEKAYLDFIDSAEKELSKLKSAGQKQRFKAKKLVFQYAEVVKKDPVLPIEIAPNTIIFRKAREIYIKIRPYCLEEA